MHKAKLLLVLAAFSLTAVCGSVTTVHPLFPNNDKVVVFDPLLVGKWREPNDAYITIVIRRDGKSAYHLSFEEPEGPGESDPDKTLEKALHLLNLGSYQMLDVEGQAKKGVTHEFVRIRIEPDTLHIVSTSSWLEQQATANR